MNRKVFVFASILLISASFSTASAASLSVTGFAWSDTIGWIQMNPSLGGVTLDDATGNINGYAWSDNIGWVSFDATDGTHPSAIINNIATCGASCVVTGWAKALAGGTAQSGGWDGWMKMSDTIAPAYSVNLNRTTNSFSGWAWGSDVVGWISFSGVGISNPVPTPTPTPTPTPSPTPSPSPSPTPTPVISYTLAVSKNGTGAGTVASSPSGIDCGSDCLEDYASGTVVTLTAAPSAGSEFAGWSVAACPGTGNCVVSMIRNRAVTATFNSVAPSGDFTLGNDGPIFVTIIDNPPSNVVSTRTSINVPFFEGITSPIQLSVSSISPIISGYNAYFSDSALNYLGASYESSEFWVDVPSATEDGLYNITVQGNVSGLIRTTTVQLNVEHSGDDWEPF